MFAFGQFLYFMKIAVYRFIQQVFRGVERVCLHCDVKIGADCLPIIILSKNIASKFHLIVTCSLIRNSVINLNTLSILSYSIVYSPTVKNSQR